MIPAPPSLCPQGWWQALITPWLTKYPGIAFIAVSLAAMTVAALSYPVFVRLTERLKGLNESERPLWIFKMAMAGIAILSFGFILTKAACGRPASVSVLLLLIVFGSAIFLATIGLELFKRVHTVKIGSWLELIVASQKTVFDLTVPVLTRDKDPFEEKPLTVRQRWEFQRGIDLFLHLQHQKLDPFEFFFEDRQRYREFLLGLGWAALREKSYELARTLVQKVEELMNQESTRSGKRLPPFTPEELFHIGNAYLYAADALYEEDAEANVEESRRGWREALRVYETVNLVTNPYAWLAMRRGWAYIQLKNYEAADIFLSSLDLSRFEPGAQPYLRIDQACAKVWLGKAANTVRRQQLWGDALKILENIEPGPWWEEYIVEDKDIALLRKDKIFGAQIENLIFRKRLTSAGGP